MSPLPQARDRADSGPAEQLAQIVLQALDCGVVVVDRQLAMVSFANREGARALAALGAAGGRVPAVLATALAARSAGDLCMDRFSPGVLVVAPDGAQFYVRGRRLGAPFGGGVLVITMARLRRAELVERLHEQTGLSRRRCECVALVRDGQRNHQIASALGLSPGTVGQYLVDVYEKLGVSGRAALVAKVEELAHVSDTARTPRSGLK